MVLEPYRAFDKAKKRLNGKNLHDLWSASCILSCIDYFDSWANQFSIFFPLLYPEKLNLLHRAILESKAADYKIKVLEPGDIPYILNALNDATAQRSDLLTGPDDPIVRIRRMLSTMAHQQLRPQENLLPDRIGRTYAFLHEIPIEYHDELKRQMGRGFFNLNQALEEHIGLSMVEFLGIGFALFGLMQKRYQANISISDERREYIAVQDELGTRRRAEAIKHILISSQGIRANFTFKTKDLNFHGSSILVPDKIERYLAQLSRTTKQLRKLMRQNSVYSKGFLPDRLNPLERYPIVQLESETYIIPNLRHFDMAVTEVIHYILQEHYPNNEYNQLRGYIQEIYLRVHLQRRLPSLLVLPEISYKKGKSRIDGPDLTVVDSEEGTLITIESKAKRMRVVARVYPGEHYLLEDLKTTLEAFEKLPSKTKDLYTGLPEYGAYQAQIDTTKDQVPIAVVVLGEGVYFINELLNDQLQADTDHVLNRYPYPYCLMRIEDFEKAVEIAATNNKPLYGLLHEYWLASQSTNINQASAQAFAGHTILRPPLTREYADRFFKLFEAQLQKPAP